MLNSDLPVVPSLITLAFMFPFAGAIINLSDPPLRGEVAAIIDAPVEKPSDPARRAYAFLLGLAAGERVDPEKRGQSEFARILTPEFANAPTLTDPWSVDFTGCGEDAAECGVADLTPGEDPRLTKDRAALDLYLRLIEYADFDASPARTAALPFSPVTIPGSSVHELFTLQLAKWFRDGGEVRAWHALESSNLFHSAVLRRGGPLLNRVLAANALRMNARVLKRELARRPGRPPTPDLIRSFDLPDLNDVLHGALAAEVEGVHARVTRAAFSWRRLLLRPRETVNVHYAIVLQSFFTDCRDAGPACVPALAYVNEGARAYLVNQWGHRLLREATTGLNVRESLKAWFTEILNAKEQFRARS